MDSESLIKIEHRLSVMETEIRYMRESQDAILKKMDSLTGFKYMVIGACTVISVIIGFIANFFSYGGN